jgi:hypothetical protein
VASHNILHKRNVALAAAYATVDKSLKEYKNRVVDRFGKEVDQELSYGIKATEVEETVTDENGEEKVVKKTVNTINSKIASPYSRFFDETCEAWDKDAEYNLFFLRAQEKIANNMLQTRGHLFLNEVYDMLGMERTKMGQTVGWIYKKDDPNFSNYVDFGIYDGNDEASRRFVNGLERSILLDFNVDGDVLDLI